MIIVMIVFQEKIRKNELLPFLIIIVGIIVLPITYELYKNDLNISSFLLGDILIIYQVYFMRLMQIYPNMSAIKLMQRK